MLPVAVIYSGLDGRRFADERPQARAVCALSPSAAFAVRDVGLPILDGNAHYGDNAQARTLVFREQLRSAWKARVPASEAPDSAEWYMLDLALVTLLHGYDRLRRAVGSDGPWLVPDGNGWSQHQRRQDACIGLSRHVLGHYWSYLGNIVCKPPPFASLYRLLRNALIGMGRGRRLSWVTTRSDHPLGLERALASESRNSRQWHLAAADGGWREYLRLGREMARVLVGSRQVQLRAIPESADISRRRAMHAIEAVTEPEIRALLKTFSIDIVALCGIVGGSRRDFARMLRQLRPDFLLASETADGITAALFEACGDLRIVRRLASHNSFGPVRSRINKLALLHQIGHQYTDGAPEQMMFWNRPSLEAAQQAFPEAATRCTAIDAIPLVPASPKRPAAAQFHVLHASNCMRYFSRPSWIFENVNEFVAGAAALVQAGLGVANTTYTIRTKVRRHEMDEASLRALLPATDRVDIAFRHTRPFVEDLGRADLLVAFRSTTIMQALYSRIPVLLWGVTRRYRELEGRRAPPRPGDRAAVYSIDGADEIPAMLAGIRDAHHGIPLTDSELAAYVFPPGTMNVRAWAHQCTTSHSA